MVNVLVAVGLLSAVLTVCYAAGCFYRRGRPEADPQDRAVDSLLLEVKSILSISQATEKPARALAGGSLTPDESTVARA
jgi:hypothetical protein